MGRKDGRLMSMLARPFVRPLLGRVTSLVEQAQVLDARIQSLQAQLVELAHAHQQLAAHQGELLEGAQLLDVLGRTTTELREMVEGLQERTVELERSSTDVQKTVNDVLDAISGQNEVARASRREALKVQSDLVEAVSRLEERVQELAPGRSGATGARDIRDAG